MSAADLNNERDLLLRMSRGEEEAFTAIYKHYFPEINRFILGYLKIPQLAGDTVQEIFIKIWNERGRLPELGSFRAFLYVLARNHTLNTLRSASRYDEVIGEMTKKHLASRKDADDEMLTKDYLAFLQKTIEALPPRGREVFRLCRQEGRTYEEVAALLGISKNSVKNHMVSSMRSLKEAVERDLGIPLALFLIIITGK